MQLPIRSQITPILTARTQRSPALEGQHHPIAPTPAFEAQRQQPRRHPASHVIPLPQNKPRIIVLTPHLYQKVRNPPGPLLKNASQQPGDHLRTPRESMRVPPRRPLKITRVRAPLLQIGGVLGHDEQHLGVKDNPLDLKQTHVQVPRTILAQDPHLGE